MKYRLRAERRIRRCRCQKGEPIPEGRPVEPEEQLQHVVQIRTPLLMTSPVTGLVPTTFRWRSGDPVAIEAEFHLADGEVVEYFSRDLLADGMNEQVGDGEVMIMPKPHPMAEPMSVRFLFRMDDGSGHVELYGHPAAFRPLLEHSYRLCPRGEEFAGFELDEWLARLSGENPQ